MWEENAQKGTTACGLESTGGSKAEGKTAGVWQRDLELKSNREQVGMLPSHPNSVLPDILTAARDFRGPQRRRGLAQGHTVNHGRTETRTQVTALSNSGS